ncbi:hypothetical protein BS78_07G157100 [Paspalum vaginatum]|nr:hypothetical protein BS78_07G157100 [Paspalum vaginatum]
MEFTAGSGAAPRPLPAGPLSRNCRVGGGALGVGWARRTSLPGLSLSPVGARRAVSAAGGGHLLRRRVVARSTGGGEDTQGGRSSPVRASPSDCAKGAATARKELMNLGVPAIVGQAIDPVAQLLETAYIGRLGPVELASAAVGVSVFNIYQSSSTY